MISDNKMQMDIVKYVGTNERKKERGDIMNALEY